MFSQLLRYVIGTLGFFIAFALVAEAVERRIAVTQIVEHPSLDACRKGVRDELKAQGFALGKDLKWSYENAQGNTTTAAQVARKFVGLDPDVIVAISTPSAQTAAAAARKTPIIFTAVTDPLAAKLVKSMEKPGGLITGVTDLSPVNKHIELIKRVVPGVKSIGIIYNPGEVNSVSLVRLTKEQAAKAGLKVVEAGAPRSADVLSAARSLVGKVEAIYVPTDNTVMSTIEAVVKVGIENKLPIIGAASEMADRGVAVALGFNYYDVGRQTGKLVARVLRGEKPGDISVQSIDKLELHVNPQKAQEMGIKLKKDLIDEASKVIR